MQKCLSNADLEIGVDEAGRGPLIGRVYAGAVIWGSTTKDSELITDSKKLSAKKRAQALEWIYANVKAWGVGWAEPVEIDQINILEATKKAMERAIVNLKSKINLENVQVTFLIDGTGWEKKFPGQNVKSVIKGDATYLSIAAASIIAKEHHDKYILDLCGANPDLDTKYNLSSNMGYGTKAHLEGLATHGNSPYHRKSFRPCCDYN